MQDLITGVPGAGKSQRALWLALNDTRYAGRQIYYHNFGELNKIDPRIADWIELTDFTQWHKLPAGSVLLVDECQSQGILPQRSATAAPPEHIEAFSKSRKLGIDVILVTQHAKNMDLFVRRLIEHHEHLTRSGQFNYATVTEYQNYQDTDGTVDPATIRKKTRWLYDKTIWTLYKSSQQHTVKPRLHRTVYYFIAALVAVAVILPLSIYSIKNLGKKKDANGNAITPAVVAPSTGIPGAKPEPVSLSHLSPQARAEYVMHETRDWGYERIPLNPDYPESAPLYDEVRIVKTFPRVSGCITKQAECKCVDQQGTPVALTQTSCLDFVVNGRFDPYRDETPKMGQLATAQTFPGQMSPTPKQENCVTFPVYGLTGAVTMETRCSSTSAPLLTAPPAPSAPSVSGTSGTAGSIATAPPIAQTNPVMRGGYVN